MTPEQIATIRLLSVKGMGPARLRWIVGEESAERTVAELVAGRVPTWLSGEQPGGVTRATLESWGSALRSASPDQAMSGYRKLAVTVLDRDDPRWPFHHDPEPPALLFCLGRVELLEARPAVAVVGTRRCSSVGRRVAHEFGGGLAAAGVSVVSGLALGIDGAAHVGALAHAAESGSAPGVIGVVASGLDIVYPGGHRDLWNQVAADGLLCSETPLGIRPARWRFPARNRLIAALSDVIVVVESHAAGGALSTAEEAAVRDRPVLAVPGSVMSASSAGTNALLVDGCGPARSVDDVLDLLGLSSQLVLDLEAPSRDDPLLAVVRREVTAGSVDFDVLQSVTGLSIQQLMVDVQRLALDGVVVLDGNRVRLP